MSEDKKNPVEKAMERECIFLVTAALFAQALSKYAMDDPPKVKCRGPVCGQYNIFNNYCGFSR